MKRTGLLLATGASMAIAACGGSGATSSSSMSSSSSTPPALSVAAPTAPPTDPPPGAASDPAPADPSTPSPGSTTTVPAVPTAASSVEEVRPAVVRIVGAQPPAVPAGGPEAVVPGSGSGFVIDPRGLAVTAHHVVTGAGPLSVFVGDEERPRRGRVLGVAECADLAVIRIDGTDFEYLDWSDAPVATGTAVFAAGFPIDGPAYAVVDGIVTDAGAAGDRAWASVASMIEHSAVTLAGTSGGPLVDADGAVVAVAHAGDDPGRALAVGVDVARPLVEMLATGQDVASIGISGTALIDARLSGISVTAVEPGSPADATGIRPRDRLLAIDSIPLATDGTMADYCTALGERAPDDPSAIEVYRPDLDVRLEGELGGRALQAVSSFETEFDEVVPGESADGAQYVTLTDDSQLIEVSVPAAWTDVDRRGWLSDLATGSEEIIGPALSASPDLAAFASGWGTPGVFVGASPLIGVDADAALDAFDFSGDCRLDGRFDYDDGVYTGRFDLYTGCGPEGSVLFQVFAAPSAAAWLAMVQVVAVSDADLAALDRIFQTFVVGELAG